VIFNKILENLLLFEKRIANGLKILNLDLTIIARFQNTGIVMHCLISIQHYFQFMLSDVLFGGLHEALDGKKGQIRCDCLIEQRKIVD
jgi:hypothetical protein